jgi:hypothetical protein
VSPGSKSQSGAGLIMPPAGEAEKRTQDEGDIRWLLPSLLPQTNQKAFLTLLRWFFFIGRVLAIFVNISPAFGKGINANRDIKMGIIFTNFI